MTKRTARKTLNIARDELDERKEAVQHRRKSTGAPFSGAFVYANMGLANQREPGIKDSDSSDGDNKTNQRVPSGRTRKSCGSVYTGKRRKSLSNKLENVLTKKMSLVSKVSRGIQYVDNPLPQSNFQILPTPSNTCNIVSVGSSRISKDSGVGSSREKNAACEKADLPILDNTKHTVQYVHQKCSATTGRPINTRLRGFGYPHDLTIECAKAFIVYEKLNLGSYVWLQLINSENLQAARYYYFRRQRYITSQTRSILLDWLSEVCEAFQFKKETYYMATEYVDRYLALDCDVRCSHLQLIGISCLYISSKVEEIFPPNLTSFVDVTDGAAGSQDILNYEILILQALSWQLIHMNSYKWLILFVRNHHYHKYVLEYLSNDKSLASENSFDPVEKILSNTNDIVHCDKLVYFDIEHITMLLEVAVLDEESLKYPSIVLASAIFYLFYKCDESLEYQTGFKTSQINTCMNWLSPFHAKIGTELSRHTRAHPLSYGGLSASRKVESYHIQSHRSAAQILSMCKVTASEETHSVASRRSILPFR